MLHKKALRKPNPTRLVGVLPLHPPPPPRRRRPRRTRRSYTRPRTTFAAFGHTKSCCCCCWVPKQAHVCLASQNACVYCGGGAGGGAHGAGAAAGGGGEEGANHATATHATPRTGQHKRTHTLTRRTPAWPPPWMCLHVGHTVGKLGRRRAPGPGGGEGGGGGVALWGAAFTRRA